MHIVRDLEAPSSIGPVRSEHKVQAVPVNSLGHGGSPTLLRFLGFMRRNQQVVVTVIQCYRYIRLVKPTDFVDTESTRLYVTQTESRFHFSLFVPFETL